MTNLDVILITFVRGPKGMYVCASVITHMYSRCCTVLCLCCSHCTLNLCIQV